MTTALRGLACLWVALTQVGLPASGFQLPVNARQPGSRPSVRFHHVHYVVGDPGAALGPAAEKLGGVRALVQGLGVGIRVGREYVLFDRADERFDLTSMRPLGVNAPDEATRWLESQGLVVEPPLMNFPVASALPADAGFDHLGFAAGDFRAVLTLIKEKPISATDNVARFRLPSGSIVEVVRDTDRPDAYWCPMHPEVRRSDAAKCPRCGMDLVPIPPPRLGELRMDVALTQRPGGGAAGLTVTIRDPKGARGLAGQDPIVSSFIDVHERPLHLFIVSRDLETFAHVHPERRPNGSFVLRHDLPPGAYGVMADFLPATGISQLLQRVVVTPGYSGSLFNTPALSPSRLQQENGGLLVTLNADDLKPRRASTLRFLIADASTNAPVTDLEPYLGAAGHLLVVSPDLATAFHAHPDGGITGGPTVTFDPIFPAPGLYKMWVQFQRKGQVIMTPFVVQVP